MTVSAIPARRPGSEAPGRPGDAEGRAARVPEASGGGRAGSPFESFQFGSGDLGDLFGNLFGGRGASSGPQAGGDLRAESKFPFRDAVLGGMAALSLRREKPCPTCGGSGRAGKDVCPTCRGEGVVVESERVRMKIPRARKTAASSACPARAARRPSAAVRGDLYVTVRVSPHPYFERHGNDIHGLVPSR